MIRAIALAIRTVVLGIFVCVAATAPVHGGFYVPPKPTSPLVTPTGPQALPWEIFRDQLGELLSIGDPIRESKPRKKAIERRDQLLKLGPAATADDLAELGYWQWRLREPERALERCRLPKLRDQRSFWPLANLGTLVPSSGSTSGSVEPPRRRVGLVSVAVARRRGHGQVVSRRRKVQMNLLRARLRENGGTANRLRPPADIDAAVSRSVRRTVGAIRSRKNGRCGTGQVADRCNRHRPAIAALVPRRHAAAFGFWANFTMQTATFAPPNRCSKIVSDRGGSMLRRYWRSIGGSSKQPSRPRTPPTRRRRPRPNPSCRTRRLCGSSAGSADWSFCSSFCCNFGNGNAAATRKMG